MTIYPWRTIEIQTPPQNDKSKWEMSSEALASWRLNHRHHSINRCVGWRRLQYRAHIQLLGRQNYVIARWGKGEYIATTKQPVWRQPRMSYERREMTRYWACRAEKVQGSVVAAWSTNHRIKRHVCCYYVPAQFLLSMRKTMDLGTSILIWKRYNII